MAGQWTRNGCARDPKEGVSQSCVKLELTQGRILDGERDGLVK